MPRPPKNKAAPEPGVPMVAQPSAPAFKAHPVIDVDQFIRVRDSVYQRLQTIQDLIRSFSQDYLRQTNLLIGEGTNLENGGELDRIAGSLTNLVPAALAAPQPAVEEKKERKKRTHDPNAPKRPLTPYFLYMQTARPIIANDLGDQVPKGAVQDEGQRRWSVMTPAEKLGWNQAYQYNLRLYNARVHSYKHGNPNAKNMTDEEARAYADQYGIGIPPLHQAEEAQANDQEAIAEQLQQTAAAEASPSEASEEEQPAAPAAAPTPKKKETRKRKSTAAATPAAPEPEPAKPAAATPASPDAKKRKRTSKAAEQVEEPKKSGRKKSKTG
ncbi:2f34fae9-bc73-41d4-829a-d18495d2aeaa [Thermothielavioides terrestris]|uniref:2f34fae9-bc73-41d4-829a-d18495d2aeaa n=1 Tax=Thermothielavioides terrestris TaxID=2587410 RepID=A0A3S4EXM2_9PEZI|nr:2f34fae9-bc73-41d4-829a-d18495d2aeaa [Thermothielavioides terrestris]